MKRTMRDFSSARRMKVRSTSELNSEPSDDKAGIGAVSFAEESSRETSTSGSEVLLLDYAAAMLPHPKKAHKGGEDAYFMEGSWMGVADGVGACSWRGVDPGMFSRELMGHCKALARSFQGKPDLKELLAEAVSSTMARGSATVLVAALFENTLYAANLGDAGFIVLRDWKVVASSEPMQHSFNFPFQVGEDHDPPQAAETFEVSVCKGDIILLATDGLFDNLFSRDIVEVLKSAIGSGSGLQDAATKLVKRAQEVGADELVKSPFSVAWSLKSWTTRRGGKLDDVTAIVASVS